MALTNFRIENGLTIDSGALSASMFIYAGTPEGFVTATIGSLCLDTTNGEVYKKKTGASNTGWELLSGASAIDAFDWKASVVAATTTLDGNINLANYTGTIDGVSLVNGKRYLIKNQTAPEQNGIYTWATGGAFTRATDADTSTKVTAGMAILVEEGTSYADSMWVLTTNDPITLGTTALTFSQFGAYVAGNGIDITGSTVSVKLNTTTGGVEFDGSGNIQANVDGTSVIVNSSNELSVWGQFNNAALVATSGPDTVDSLLISAWQDVVWNVLISNGNTGKYSATVHATNLGTGTTVDFNISSALRVGTITKPTINVTVVAGSMNLEVTTTAGYTIGFHRQAVTS